MNHAGMGFHHGRHEMKCDNNNLRLSGSDRNTNERIRRYLCTYVGVCKTCLFKGRRIGVIEI